MPVTIPNSLPARKILEAENVFLISKEHALCQDIRPMRIAILNLMPTRDEYAYALSEIVLQVK